MKFKPISYIKFKELHLHNGYLTRIFKNQGVSLIDLATLLKVDRKTGKK